MNRSRRRMAAGLLVLGGMVGLSGAALASEKVVDDVEKYQTVLAQVDNPCTPHFDDITLDADWHRIYKWWTDADGSWRYIGSVRSHLSGRAADGASYGGYNHFASQYRSEDGVTEITSDEHHLLVGHGTAPSFTLRLKVRAVYVGGSFTSVEVVKEGTECRG